MWLRCRNHCLSLALWVLCTVPVHGLSEGAISNDYPGISKIGSSVTKIDWWKFRINPDCKSAFLVANRRLPLLCATAWRPWFWLVSIYLCVYRHTSNKGQKGSEPFKPHRLDPHRRRRLNNRKYVTTEITARAFSKREVFGVFAAPREYFTAFWAFYLGDHI